MTNESGLGSSLKRESLDSCIHAACTMVTRGLTGDAKSSPDSVAGYSRWDTWCVAFFCVMLVSSFLFVLWIGTVE